MVTDKPVADPRRLAKSMKTGDLASVYLAPLKAYLVGWSLTDAAGKVVQVTPSAIDRLDAECADEIHARIREWQSSRTKGRPTT